MKPVISILLFLLLLLQSGWLLAGRCTGSSRCRACTSCSSCKYCNEGGGTCGVCRGEGNSYGTPGTRYNISNWWLWLVIILLLLYIFGKSSDNSKR